MEHLYEDFFASVEQMKKIRMGDLFPDMTKTDSSTLMTIAYLNREKNGGVTVSELAERMHTQASAVSRTLKTLEERELIKRTIQSPDRRNTYVALTPKGGEKCMEMKHTLGDFAKAVLEKMDEEKVRRLITYLNELNRVAFDEMELRKKREE